MPLWIAKEKIGTLLLASEMPVPISRRRTVPPPVYKPSKLLATHVVRGDSEISTPTKLVEVYSACCDILACYASTRNWQGETTDAIVCYLNVVFF